MRRTSTTAGGTVIQHLLTTYPQNEWTTCVRLPTTVATVLQTSTMWSIMSLVAAEFGRLGQDSNTFTSQKYRKKILGY